jgi:diguanylate cyclase (GGDEF)-like protein
MNANSLGLSYRSRILVYFVGIILLTLATVSTVMFFAAKRSSLGLAEQQLLVGDRIVENSLQSKEQELRHATVAVAADFGFREAVTSRDRATILSALENQAARLHADLFALLDNDGIVTQNSETRTGTLAPAVLREAQSQIHSRKPVPAIVNDRGRLLQVVITPVKAPDTVGWVCVGFVVGDDTLQPMKETAGTEISLLFLNSEDSGVAVLASTLPATLRSALKDLSTDGSERDHTARRLGLDGEPYLSLVSPGVAAPHVYSVLTQMPMAAVDAPLIALGRDMILFGSLVTVMCLAAALIGARILAQPVRALADASRSLTRSKRRGRGSAGDDELAQVARAFHALTHRAHYDALTGLPNRTLLSERLSESLQRMEDARQSLAVVFIDLNGFKKINDTLGHEMGDLVLRKTAQRLTRSVSSPNTVARLGGDEFVLVLENVSQADAMRAVEGLAAVVSVPMSSPGGPIKVGMSAGIALYPSTARDQEQLLKAADAAMYQSKAKKGAPTFADPSAASARSASTESPAVEATANQSSSVLSGIQWQGRDLVTQRTLALAPYVAVPLTAIPAGIPPDEPQRLKALQRLRYLDKPPRESFDRITRMAARFLKVPISLVSLIDGDRQWFMSRVGMDAAETPRDISFCAHAVFERAPLVVPDASRDERFSGNPLVTGEPNIRSYAGTPLYTSDGRAIGTLCVCDRTPRTFDDTDLRTLQDLARIIEDMMRARELTLANRHRRNKELADLLGS